MSATTSLISPVNKQIRRFSLHLPLILLWLLLLPFTPILWLGLLLACIAGGVNPFRAVAALFRVFATLRGTRVEFESCQISILLSLF